MFSVAQIRSAPVPRPGIVLEIQGLSLPLWARGLVRVGMPLAATAFFRDTRHRLLERR
jgi:hypothetical protein